MARTKGDTMNRDRANEDILGLALGSMTLDRMPRNKGAFFPMDDSADFAKGVRFVPSEVTLARRRGERVVFVQDCRNPCCWRWDFPDGSVSWHWERWAYEGYGEPCSLCGNFHTSGGVTKND